MQSNEECVQFHIAYYFQQLLFTNKKNVNETSKAKVNEEKLLVPRSITQLIRIHFYTEPLLN